MNLPYKPVVHGLAVAVLAGLGEAAQAQTYNIVQIPTLNVAQSSYQQEYVQGISSTGLITGYFEILAPPPNGQGYSGTQAFRQFQAQVIGGVVTEQSVGYLDGNSDPTDRNAPSPGNISYAFGINASGTIAGAEYTGNGYYENGMPFNSEYEVTMYTGTAPQGIGSVQTVSGLSGGNFDTQTMGTAISNSGAIVGVSDQGIATSDPNNPAERSHAFVYANGGYTEFDQNQLNTSGAYGVNPAGTAVVGFRTTGTGESADESKVSKLATEWTLSNGTWSNANLPANTVVLPGGVQSVAFGVNSSGQMVGCSETGYNGGVEGVAFLRQPDGTIINLTSSLANLRHVSGPTGAIANLQDNLFEYQQRPYNLLNYNLGQNTNGMVTSCADAINDNGQIVGYADVSGVKQAFLATVNSSNGVTVTNLNTTALTSAGWFLNEATSINDAGQIIGYGTLKGVQTTWELNVPLVTTWGQSSGGSWAAAGSWAGGVPNGQSAMATFGPATPGLTTAGSITLDGNKTVGNITFSNTNSYSINPGTGGTLTIDDTNDISGASPNIVVTKGNHTINVPLSLTTNNGSMGVTVNTWINTSLTLTQPVTGVNGGTGVFTAAGSGNLIFSPTATLGLPLVANGNTVTFSANTDTSAGLLVRKIPSINIASFFTNLDLAPALSHSSRQVLVTNSLTISNGIFFPAGNSTWQGKLDLANNDLIVRNGNLANITSQLAQGYDNGKFDGSPGFTWDNFDTPGAFNVPSGGIISSSAAADTTHLTTLGSIQNGVAGSPFYTAFDGQPLSGGEVLVKYTYYGDSNLDGKVNSSDYTLIDNGFNQKLTGWLNGDFNYDGVVNGADYSLIDNAFLSNSASLSAIASPTGEIAGFSGVAEVPEPTSLGLLSLSVIGLLGRRSRR